MSLRFIDGFDHYTAADITKKWNAIGPTGTVAIQLNNGRISGNSIRIDPLGCFLQKTLDNQATWIVGIAMQTPGLPPAGQSAVIMQWLDGANGVQCDLRVNADGTLSITRNGAALAGGTSTASLKVGGYHYIEAKVTISTSILASSCQVQLDSNVVITVATGQSTQSTANATANTIVLAGAAVGCLFDDVYICDGTGAVNNTFLNDCRVVTLFPNGAGFSTQFSVTGAATNWQAVSNNPPQTDITYVSSNTPGQIDLYTVGNLAVAGTIKGVQTVVDARKDDAGARQLAAEIRIGGTNYVGASAFLATSYQMNSEIRETNPNTGVAWTQADINTPLQIGFNLTA
jgi:hypothetical protein